MNRKLFKQRIIKEIMKKKSIFIFLITLVLSIYLVTAFIQITPISPSGNSITDDYSISITQNFTLNDTLSVLKWNWNSTNYTIYDDSLVLMYNFDNRSTIPCGGGTKENDTCVADLSKYGNNGTVADSGVVVNTTGCKYNSCFTFNSSNNNYLTTGISKNLNTTSWTIMVWAKSTGTCSEGDDIFVKAYDYRVYVTAACYASVVSRNASGSGSGKSISLGNISDRNWHHLVFVYNISENKTYGYKDGVYVNSKNMEGIFSTTNSFNIGGGGSSGGEFNGSIDEIMLFNKSLSASEISQLYKISLTKFNSTNYQLYSNQSIRLENLSTTNLNESYDYGLFVNDTAGNSNSTLNTITRIPLLTSTSGNFTTSKGTVNNNFYGTNIQNPTRIVGPLDIDADCDGTSETASNITWLQNTLLNSKMNYNRYDMSLGSYYRGIENPDFEYWLNSTTSYNKSGQRVRGYYVSSSSGGNATISRSTTAHHGSYSLNVTATSSSGYLYVFAYPSSSSALNLADNTNYTATFWVNGNGTFSAKFREGSPSYAICDNNSFNLASVGTWVQINLTCNITTAYTNGYEIILADGINPNESILIDDFTLYTDGTKSNYWRYGNSSAFENMINWTYNNNQRVLLISDYMPIWLANTTANCTSSESDTDVADCPPYDYSVWTSLNIDFINRITEEDSLKIGIIDIEVWNEPYGASWMDNLSTDSISKAYEYVNLYNNTYNTLKSNFSNIGVGGPCGYYTALNMSKTFLSNMTTNMDFISYHPYINSYESSTDGMLNKTQYLFDLCSTYGANCTRMVNSEWGVTSYTIKNQSGAQSNQYGTNIAWAYHDWLNNYPANISSQFYHWLDTVSYFNCPSRYDEYPAFWSAISEAGLDNTSAQYYPPFNITKNFATYCPAGSTVYASSSNESNLKTVTCKKGNSANLIIINTDVEAKNITLNLSSMPSTIRDYSTKTSYTPSQNTKYGLVDSYNIVYLGNGIYGDYNGAYWNKPLNEITETNSNLTTLLKNTDTISRTTEVYNLTNALIYNKDNGTTIGVLINSNDGNINISMPSLTNYSILNNFNVSERYTRINSPISITLSNPDTIHLNSSLSNSINVTFQINESRDCNDLASLKYTSENGYTFTYYEHDAENICNELKNGFVIQIDPASSSNVLDFTYLTKSCVAMNEVIIQTVSWLTIIILCVVFAAILSVVFLSIKGYPNLEEFTSILSNLSIINWKSLLIGLVISILIISILVTLTVLFNAQICLN